MGSIGLDPNAGFPVELAVQVQQGALRRRHARRRALRCRPEAHRQLCRQGPLLEGAVSLDRTEITVPERLPRDSRGGRREHVDAAAAGRGDARDRARGQRCARGAAAAASPPASGSMSTVNAPQRIFVRGRGLDTEFGGDLRLVGPISALVGVRRVPDGARPARYPDAADHLRPRHRHLRRRPRSDPGVFRLDAERRHRPSPSRSPAAPPIRR